MRREWEENLEKSSNLFKKSKVYLYSSKEKSLKKKKTNLKNLNKS
jgi:hypothetical protein